MSFKILITGASGHLGSELMLDLQKTYKCEAIHRNLLSRERKNDLLSFISKKSPDFIINCAAIVGLKKAQSNYKAAHAINSLLPKKLVELSKKKKFHLIQISTNSVFEGVKNTYNRYENTNPIPKTTYGITKFLGEEYVRSNIKNSTILRISNLYSSKIQFKSNILKKIYSDICKNEVIIERNELISPVSIDSVVKAIKDIIINKATGIFHCVDAGSCNWENLIKLVSNEVNKRPKITNLTKKKLNLRNSTISSKNTFSYYGEWKEGVYRAINKIKKFH